MKDMGVTLQQWIDFLDIDQEIIDTLRDFFPILAPRIDRVSHAFYRRVLNSPEAIKLFADEDSANRALAHQKRHWLEYVFAGRFDRDYVEAALRMGKTHQQRGVDLRLFSGAYAVVLSEVNAIVMENVPDPQQQKRVLRAVNFAVFLDLGFVASVYYDAYTDDLASMAKDLTVSLARAGEYRDADTGEHIHRMAKMCAAVARHLGKDLRWVEQLEAASPLHDVGKIGIPDAILLKPGKLTEEEMSVMRRHSEIGTDIIPDNDHEILQMARHIALTHHERWDGTGYPAGLRGEEIPLEGRIAAVCDVYDALRSQRPYKRPWSHDEAVEYLKQNRGTQFDPAVVDACLAALPEIEDIWRRYGETPSPSSSGAS
jgi:putative two-component system response regulator